MRNLKEILLKLSIAVAILFGGFALLIILVNSFRSIENIFQVFDTIFTILIISIISSYVFTAVAINEINTSKLIDVGEKMMWIVGLFLFPSLVGIIYMFIRQKRILPNE